MVVKKYIVNVSSNFEEEREIIKSLYFGHKPTKKEIKRLMKRYKCKYVHIGTYYKKIKKKELAKAATFTSSDKK